MAPTVKKRKVSKLRAVVESKMLLAIKSRVTPIIAIISFLVTSKYSTAKVIRIIVAINATFMSAFKDLFPPCHFFRYL